MVCNEQPGHDVDCSGNPTFLEAATLSCLPQKNRWFNSVGFLSYHQMPTLNPAQPGGTRTVGDD